MRESDETMVARQLRECAQFIDENAEELAGDLTRNVIVEDGIKVILENFGRGNLPTVEVRKTFYALDQEAIRRIYVDRPS